MSEFVGIEMRGSKELANAIAYAAASLKNMAPALRRIGLYMVRSVQKTIEAGGRPALWPVSRAAVMRGGQPLRHHGILRSSIAYQTDRDSVKIGISQTAAKYGTILHYGGVFTTKGKLFTIPLSQKAAKLREKVKTLREIKGLFFMRSRSGNGLLALNIGHNNFELMFALRRSITIPAFPFMLTQDEDEHNIAIMLREHVDGIQ